MRAQTLVDAKRFSEGLDDYNAALQYVPCMCGVGEWGRGCVFYVHKCLTCEYESICPALHTHTVIHTPYMYTHPTYTHLLHTPSIHTLSTHTPYITPPPASDLLDRARILSGRALAHEGLAAWQAALQDYTVALDMAAQANAQPDPYVLNSRGNVLASLARYAEARQDYLQSAQLFQGAKGFRGANGSTTMRLDGMDDVIGET